MANTILDDVLFALQSETIRRMVVDLSHRAYTDTDLDPKKEDLLLSTAEALATVLADRILEEEDDQS